VHADRLARRGQSAPVIDLTVDVPTSMSGVRESDPLASVIHVGDRYPDNDADADPARIVTTADLALTRQQPAQVRVGDTVTFRYHVRNVGVETAEGAPAARLTDQLARGLTPVGYQTTDAWDCELREDAVACALTSPLGSDESATVNVRMRVGREALPETGTRAVVTAAQGDPNPANDSRIETTQVVETDVALKAAQPRQPRFEVGRNGTFGVQVANEGGAPTAGPVRVRLPLASGVSFVETGVYGGGWDCRLSARTVVCDREQQLAAGASAPELGIEVRPSAANKPRFSSTFSVETLGDEHAANDTLQRTDDVFDPPAEPGTPAAGTNDGTNGGQTTTNGAGAAPAVTGGQPLNARLLSGALRLGTLAPVDLAAGTLTVAGQVGGDGTVAVPQSGVRFRALQLPIEANGLKLNAKIILSALGPATGRMTPGGGPATFDLPVRAKIEAALENGTPLLGSTSDCYIGPIDFKLTGTYDAAAKRATLGAPNVALPQAGAGCGALGKTVNDLLSLPSDKNGLDLVFALDGVGDAADAPEGPQTVIPTATATGSGTPKLGTLRSTLSGGTSLDVPVTCPEGPAACTGRVEIVAAGGGARAARVTLLGRKAYRVAGGKTAKVRVKLTPAARKRVRQAGRQGLRVTVRVVPQGASKAAATKSMRIKLPVPKRRG
jgi:uncharacterized repeat protein (TIGR01451 family)